MGLIDMLQYWAAIVAGSRYWQVTTAILVVTAIVQIGNMYIRARIDAALARPQVKAMGMFDLSYGGAKARIAVPPERLWTYDVEYLRHFARRAESDKVLGLYVRNTLRGWDLAFAFLLAAFGALFMFGLADALWSSHPWWSALLLIAAAMSVLYGVADIAEDLKLAHILSRPAAKMDAAEAAAACMLTRIKLVSIGLSIVDFAVFIVLIAVGRVLFLILAAFARPATAPAARRSARAR